MTTDLAPRSRAAGGFAQATLTGAIVVTVVVGSIVAALGGLLAGSTALAGALVGLLLAVAVLASGTATVAVVAATLPPASLLVALLTYVLQVLMLGVAFWLLTGSGLLDDALDRTWLGATLVVATLTWSVAQIRLATTARIPAFDLSVEPAPGVTSEVTAERAERGAR